MSDEPKVNTKPSRHSRRQRIVRQVRRAARAENYSDVLKYFLDLCLYEMEGNNALSEKISLIAAVPKASLNRMESITVLAEKLL